MSLTNREHLSFTAGKLDRAVKQAAINSVRASLEYEAPERLWERRREIAQRAIHLATLRNVDSDLIADALLRSLLPDCY